jgi:GT2 family glycosyltransferase
MNTQFTTIVMVSLNNVENVKKTFSSVSHLPSDSFSVLVVDSSSDSQVRMFISEVSSSSKLDISYFWEKPAGVYSAMNTGIDKSADNSLIWFLNPGDVLVDTNVLQSLILKIGNENVFWGFAQAQNAMPQSNIIYPLNNFAVTRQNLARGDLRISHQGMLVKKELLIKLNKFDIKKKIASDLELTIKLADFQCASILNVMVEIELNGISRKKPWKVLFETASVVYDARVYNPVQVRMLFFFKACLLVLGYFRFWTIGIAKVLIRRRKMND